jgi:hypothetical protein
MKRSLLCVAVLSLSIPCLVSADELDDAYAALKQAVASKDAAKVKQEAAAAHAAALKWKAPPPADVTDKDAYAARSKYAEEVDTYSEYALYSVAIQSPANTAMDLINALEKQDPKSKYLNEPSVLSVEADYALGRKETGKALALANKLIAVGNEKAPEGVNAASWEGERDNAVGRGHWIAGVIQGEKQQYRDADRNLRAALPFIKGNNAMLAPALFYLGVADYNLAHVLLSKKLMQDAAKFSQQCAAIPGPYQDQAYKNSMTMQTEAAQMR